MLEQMENNQVSSERWILVKFSAENKVCCSKLDDLGHISSQAQQNCSSQVGASLKM